MIKYLDVLKAVNGRVKVMFPNIDIQSNDIKEGFSRPSFFIDFENIKASKLNTFFKATSIPVTIYYFPEDKNKSQMENLETQSTLEDAFLEPLCIEERFYITINEIDSMISDGVLQVSFNLEMYEDLEVDYEIGDYMDELDFELGKEG